MNTKLQTSTQPPKNPNQKPFKQQNVSKQMKMLQDQIKALKTQFIKGDDNPINTPENAFSYYKTNEEYKKSIDNSASTRMKGHLRLLEQFVGEKFMDSKVMDYDKLSPSQKITDLTIIASDDLSQILGIASKYVAPTLMNLAKEYGPKLLSWLYNKFQSKYSTQGHGSGPGQKNYYPLETISFTDNNTICLKYLASIFCPEVYVQAMSATNDPNVVSTGKESNYPVITGSDGNFFGIFLDDGVCQPGTNTNYFGSFTGLNSTYNPNNGVVGGTGYSYTQGPYYPATSANIANYRLTAISYRFIPSVSSLNNAGKVQMIYNCTSTNTTIGGASPAIPPMTLLQSQYVHIAPMKTPEFRQIGILMDQLDNSVDPFATPMTSFNNNGFKYMVLVITGALANTQVGDLYATANIDYTPGDSLAGIVKPQPTPDAPATLMCFGSIIKQFPQLSNIGEDESKNLAQHILSCPSPSYPVLMSHLQQHVLQYKKKPTTMANQQPSQQAIGDLSFDVIQE